MLNNLWVSGFNFSYQVLAGGALVAFVLWMIGNKIIRIVEQARQSPKSLIMAALAYMIIPTVIIGALMRIGGFVNSNVNGALNAGSLQAMGQAGSELTHAMDQLMVGGGYAGGGGTPIIAPASQYAALQPLGGNGNGQPPVVNASAPEAQPMTNDQAVAAINALAATATPAAQVYINEFVANNMPTVVPATNANGTYTVKGGDSLAKIARAFYSDTELWVAICNANRAVIADCNHIRSGMVLTIPAAEVAKAGGQRGGTVTTVPAAWGQQSATYNVQPTVAPVYAQPATQPATLQRNATTGDSVITSNNDAVAAIQALGPLPTLALAAPIVVAPTATPIAVYTIQELAAQRGDKPNLGGGQAYIDQFLKSQTDTTLADAGASN